MDLNKTLYLLMIAITYKQRENKMNKIKMPNLSNIKLLEDYRNALLDQMTLIIDKEPISKRIKNSKKIVLTENKILDKLNQIGE